MGSFDSGLAVSLDDQANDGAASGGGTSNVHSDVENIDTGYGPDIIVGSSVEPDLVDALAIADFSFSTWWRGHAMGTRRRVRSPETIASTFRASDDAQHEPHRPDAQAGRSGPGRTNDLHAEFRLWDRPTGAASFSRLCPGV